MLKVARFREFLNDIFNFQFIVICMVVGREECLLLLLILRASDTKESELDWQFKFGKSVEALFVGRWASLQ